MASSKYIRQVYAWALRSADEWDLVQVAGDMKTRISFFACVIAIPALLSGCGGGSSVHHPVTSRSSPNRVSVNEAAGRPDPGKDYPVAERIDGRPDLVRSPYTQELIEIRRLKTGPLVEDPTVRLAKRFFLMPAN
jgi:hypothetical protein